MKNEERYAEHTLRSMANQTIKPLRWVIVDDGSTDSTPALLEKYRLENSFIDIVTRPPGQPRQPGSAVVQAFNRGYETVKDQDHDYVVKLDCDLSFDPSYFESLFAQFAADSKLGITSGVYLELNRAEGWVEIPMPSYHAAGASKIIRRDCFAQIGGFCSSRGWDTIDEIRAMSRGWKTRHFVEAKMKHWKPEGAGIGSTRTAIMHGEIYYLTGGSKLSFFLKVLNRLRTAPFLLGALAMFWGYIRTAFAQKPRLVTENEARCYQTLLNGRIYQRCRRLLGTG